MSSILSSSLCKLWDLSPFFGPCKPASCTAVCWQCCLVRPVGWRLFWILDSVSLGHGFLFQHHPVLSTNSSWLIPLISFFFLGIILAILVLLHFIWILEKCLFLSTAAKALLKLGSVCLKFTRLFGGRGDLTHGESFSGGTHSVFTWIFSVFHHVSPVRAPLISFFSP